MARDRTCKTTSFNNKDPFELQLLRHSEQYKGFSAYIKRLIQRDMEVGAITSKQLTQQASAHSAKTPSTEGKPKMLGFV